MSTLWWLALPVLLLPVWWHRQRRESSRARPLATARFLPQAEPQQRRVWQWVDRILLLLRCLLLVTVIAWLADLTLPWRGDTVLLAPGTDAAWASAQIAQAGFGNASRIDAPEADVLGWLYRHEREWRSNARLLVLGPLPMSANMPRYRHAVELRTLPAKVKASEQRVAIFSKRMPEWRAMFAALDGVHRYRVDSESGGRAELVIWDLPEAPPAGLEAPLWWVGESGLAAFPELHKAPSLAGLRYAASARGRIWSNPAWPARDADGARATFALWQQLHYAPVPYIVPPQRIEAPPFAPQFAGSGAMRGVLAIVLLVLFALERSLTHARRR
jgi:hypothetical protein